MYRKLRLILTIFFSFLISTYSYAIDIHSPIGQWKTIDDQTGKEKSIVEIYEEDDELKGKIVRLLQPDSNDPNPRCRQCTDHLKDKPIIGLTFLWGLKKDGIEYVNGHILDPKNGKIYKAKISLDESGKKLNVRGFIGFALLGRTQVWLRVE